MAQIDTSAHQGTPVFVFDFDQSLVPWNMPAREWLTNNDKHWTGLATACLVFNQEGRILLVQRASHDSMPDRWEVPGGAADEDDPTILHAAARELWEEAGLLAKRFTHLVPGGPNGEAGAVFTNRTGLIFFCRFGFNVEVESVEHVRLDPNEHQDYLWATEDEVEQEKVGARDIPMTHPLAKKLLLEGFRLRAGLAKGSTAEKCDIFPEPFVMA